MLDPYGNDWLPHATCHLYSPNPINQGQWYSLNTIQYPYCHMLALIQTFQPHMIELLHQKSFKDNTDEIVFFHFSIART